MTNRRSPRGARSRRWLAAGCAILLLGVFAGPTSAGPAPAVDLDKDNALLLLLAATEDPERRYISPDGSDVTLIVHYDAILATAIFDAVAPYHPTAVGIFSNLGRRPAAEATQRNKNVAVMYAAYRVLLDVMPQAEAQWRGVMTAVGLDPDDDRESTETAVGLGNLAARGVLERRAHDGMNRLGDEGGMKYQRRPYADYTGYQPVNTAYELRDPSRWQPDVVAQGNGTFRVQQFVTPQLGRTEAFTFDDPSRFRLPPPRDSDHRRKDAYRRQADEVLAASAALTDRQKMVAELFNDKIESFGVIGAAVIAGQDPTNIDRIAQVGATLAISNFDTMVATWYHKARYDAVRPISAIRYLYEDRQVTAWGGPGKGTVSDITGKEWRGYLNTADHPEYPSGSAALCTAFAEAAQLVLGTDETEIVVNRPAGSSTVEPGVTPAADLTLRWTRWTDFAADCGMSRLWGGVHFRPAVERMRQFAPQFGRLAYEFVQRHVNGEV